MIRPEGDERDEPARIWRPTRIVNFYSSVIILVSLLILINKVRCPCAFRPLWLASFALLLRFPLSGLAKFVSSFQSLPQTYRNFNCFPIVCLDKHSAFQLASGDPQVAGNTDESGPPLPVIFVSWAEWQLWRLQRLWPTTIHLGNNNHHECALQSIDSAHRVNFWGARRLVGCFLWFGVQ